MSNGQSNLERARYLLVSQHPMVGSNPDAPLEKICYCGWRCSRHFGAGIPAPPAPEASSKSITIEATTSTQTMASGMMYDLAMQAERESKERDRELIRKGVAAGLEEAADRCDELIETAKSSASIALYEAVKQLIRALDREAIVRKVEGQ